MRETAEQVEVGQPLGEVEEGVAGVGEKVQAQQVISEKSDVLIFNK